MIELKTHQWSTITNALRIAAETFDGHAAEFRKVTKKNAPAMMTYQGAQNLAKQFDYQAKEARELKEKIEEKIEEQEGV
jgi:hypothetical protein